MALDFGNVYTQLDLSKPDWKTQLRHLNPINLDISKPEDVETLNKAFLSLPRINAIVRPMTKAGYCSVSGVHKYSVRMWFDNIVKNGAIVGFKLVIKAVDKVYCWKMGYNSNINGISGHDAFNILKPIMKKAGFDIDKYNSNNGEEIKKEIKSPLISTVSLSPQSENYLYDNYKNWWANYQLLGDHYYFKHVNHIDLHQAYPSAIIKHDPKFLAVVNLVNSRYDHKKSKEILNKAIGYCQSVYCGFKYAELSKIAINTTVDYMLKLRDKLVSQGFLVLGYNTDGIWYIDGTGRNRLYTDEDEHEGLCGWSHDYVDCDWWPIGANWVCLDGTKKGTPHTFDFALRGNYLYNEKPRAEWNSVEDIIKAINSEIFYRINFDIETGWKVDRIEQADNKIQVPTNGTRELLKEHVTL